MGDPYADMAQMSDAGVGALPRPTQAPRKVTRAPVAEMNRRRRKGADGETEVTKLWRRNGWPAARRQPGSGAMRPYGARDSSPWPFDIASGWPTGLTPDPEVAPRDGLWLVEVKRSQSLLRPSRGSNWLGAGFVVSTLRLVEQAWQGLQGPGVLTPCVCAFMRADREPWQVWVRANEVSRALHVYPLPGSSPLRDAGEWLMFSTDVFFDTIALQALGVRR